MNKPSIQPYFFLALLGLVLVVVYVMFRPFLSALALAGVFAVVLRPWYLWLSRRLRIGPSLGSALFTALVLVVLVVLVSLILARVFVESRQLYESLNQNQNYWEQLTLSFERPLKSILPQINLDLRDYLGTALGWITGSLGNIFSGALGVILKALLGLFAFYYFLKDGPALRQAAVDLSPLGDKYDNRIIEKVKLTINSVIKGFLAVAVVQGLLVGLGLIIFGVPNASLWGAVAAVAALVPGLGTALVSVPAMIYLLVKGSFLAALGLLVWSAFLVGLVDNLLAPVLYSRGGTIHPFFMLLSVLGGLALFGPAGFILGPIFLSLLFILVEIYHEGIPNKA